jgi:hypothetical protein
VEQVQLLAQHAVVALLGLFDPGQVGVKVLLAEERRAIDAGQAVDCSRHRASTTTPAT